MALNFIAFSERGFWEARLVRCRHKSNCHVFRPAHLLWFGRLLGRFHDKGGKREPVLDLNSVVFVVLFDPTLFFLKKRDVITFFQSSETIKVCQPLTSKCNKE